MARAALKWSGADLARSAGLGPATVARFEAGENIQPEKLEAMRSALAAEGIGFTNGGGRVGVSVKRDD